MTTSDYEAIYQATEKFQDLRMQRWLHHDLFTGVWWLLLALMIFPWIVWWKVADKIRLTELVCFEALTSVICVILDVVGTVNLWWMYKHELIIQFPGLLVADISDIPVGFMLIHQYCRTWKSFLIWIVIVSTVFSFVGEPALWQIGAYVPLIWEHFYSFAIYVAIAIGIRFVVLKMKESGQQTA